MNAGVGSNQYATRPGGPPRAASSSAAVATAVRTVGGDFAGMSGNRVWVDGASTFWENSGELDDIRRGFTPGKTNWLDDAIQFARQEDIIRTRADIVDSVLALHADQGHKSSPNWDISDLRHRASLVLLLHNPNLRAREVAASRLVEDATCCPLPENVWLKMTEDRSGAVRRCVLVDHAPLSVLLRMARDDDDNVRRRAVQCVGTARAVQVLTPPSAVEGNTRVALLSLWPLPAELLTHYSESDCAQYRAAVATNPSTPRAALMMLAADDDDDVVVAVYTAALEDSEPWPEVCDNAPRRRSPSVRKAIAWSSYCPADMLETLFNDSHTSVRIAVLHNKRCPSALLAAARQDADPAVRNAAERILARPQT